MVRGKYKFIDKELDDTLGKLYQIQKDVGGVEESKKKAEKRARQAASAKQSGAKGAKFLALKSDIIDHMQEIREIQNKAKRMEHAPGINPKAVITTQHELREHLGEIEEEWKQLDGMYKTEVSKRRSKFSSEELEMQQELVLQFQREIEQLRSNQKGAFSSAPSAIAPAMNAKNIESVISNNASPFDGGFAGSSSGGGNVELTSYQSQQITQIQMRDNEFDKDIEQIGDGIKDLHDIALVQNEEVQRQSVMLDSLCNRIDDVQDKVINVNTRMKETLRKVGGRGSKLCVDIACICLAVTIGLILFTMVVGDLKGN